MQKYLENKVLTFWIPAIVFTFLILMELCLSNAIVDTLMSENGVIEYIHCLLALLAGVFGLFCTFQVIKNKGKWWLLSWCLCFTMGCFYIAGEEISWGQWLFYWETPEVVSKLNDQNETNLHNMSSWFDQKPKTLLMLGIIFGGIVFPLLERYSRFKLPENFRIIYPSFSLIFIAFCLAILKLWDISGDIFPSMNFWTRSSEIEELYKYYFLLIYLIFLRQKLKQ